MSHLHIPDGVLPWWVWGPTLAVALLWLALAARSTRAATPQQVAYRSALGALVLVAMIVQVPLGPLEYHLTLVGPIGVLLGAAAGFQVMFVASAVLTFVGHGGFTVLGLNALVLGLGVAVSRRVYDAVAPRRSPAVASAMATVAGQTCAGALWFMGLAVAMRFRAWADVHTESPDRFVWVATVLVPLWLVGVALEAGVAFAITRFLARVRPDLLPAKPAQAPPTT